MTGWGGPHWTEPEEAQAAAEAAAKFEQNRAAADARTQALARAIREGFGMLSDAIRDAAGLDEIYEGPLEGEDMPGPDDLTIKRRPSRFGPLDDDPDITDLYS